MCVAYERVGLNLLALNVPRRSRIDPFLFIYNQDLKIA